MEADLAQRRIFFKKKSKNQKTHMRFLLKKNLDADNVLSYDCIQIFSRNF
jgi:hypothetical protein